MNQQILKINGQYAKLYVTTNSTLPEILKNSGSMIVYHNADNNFNSLWIGGEIIAGGWGFVKSTHDILDNIAITYHDTINKIIETEAHDIKALDDIYKQIIIGVDHDKWNLNNYLQKNGEYADASNTYIITSLSDFGGNTNTRIKLSQLPMLLRKTEYVDIEFSDIHYTLIYKYGESYEEKTIESTSNYIELPVYSTICDVYISFFAKFNDSSGIDNISVDISKYFKKLIINDEENYEIQQFDTSFSKIYNTSTFTYISSDIIVNEEDIENNENWRQIIYNNSDESNHIYYSNKISTSRGVYYQIHIKYSDTYQNNSSVAYYEVLEGNQKLIGVNASINPTSEDNYKLIAKDDDGNKLFDTINAIHAHDVNICNLYITGYNIAHIINTEQPISIVNQYLYNSIKQKLSNKIDFTLQVNQNKYIYLILPKNYILKGIYKLNSKGEEFNYTGYFAEVNPNNKLLYITYNPYKYFETSTYYSSYNANMYVTNIGTNNTLLKLRIYTEYDDSISLKQRFTYSFSDTEQKYNTIETDINELYTLTDEQFNETHWINSIAFKNDDHYEWEKLSIFLNKLNNADTILLESIEWKNNDIITGTVGTKPDLGTLILTYNDGSTSVISSSYANVTLIPTYYSVVDFNNDGVIDIADISAVIDLEDANNDNIVDVADISQKIDFKSLINKITSNEIINDFYNMKAGTWKFIAKYNGLFTTHVKTINMC